MTEILADGAAKAKANKSTAVMARRHSAIDSLDFFPTPPWATRAFMREVLNAHLLPHDFQTIWEPAAGEGHMANVLAEFCPNVRASDVHDYGKGFEIGSFVGQGLDVAPSSPVDWVVTNPPFNLAVEFAVRALDVAKSGVALLLRSAWAEGETRYTQFFSVNRPAMIAQYCERVPMTAGVYDPKASSATAYSWFIWRKDSQDHTSFTWIEPGAKLRNFRQSDVTQRPGDDRDPAMANLNPTGAAA